MKLADLKLDVVSVLPTSIPTLYCRNVPLSVSDKIRDLYKTFPRELLAEGASMETKLKAAPNLGPLGILVFQELACGKDGDLIDDAQTEEEILALPTALAAPVIQACMEVIGGKGKTTSRAGTTGSP